MPQVSKADLTTSLLLSLAWLGELDKSQVHRLCLSNRSLSTVEKTLSALRKDGLIEPRAWHISVEGIPHEQPSLWSLTKKGHELLVGHDQYPPKPAPIGPKRLIGHDYRTVETIVRLVEFLRPADLSGLYVQLEVRLDPEQPRPRMDALVIMQTGGRYERPDLVPWSKDRAINDETRIRLAIESDGNTEPIAVIEGKARAYGAVHRDRSWREWWQQQWGPLPFIIWVVPHGQRLDAVHAAWERVWPQGAWALTTEKSLPLNKWQVYSNRQVQGGRFDGAQLLAQSSARAPEEPRALPPAPAAPPALPSAPPAAQHHQLSVAPPRPPTASVSSLQGGHLADLPASLPRVAERQHDIERWSAPPIRVVYRLPPYPPVGASFNQPDTWLEELVEFPWLFTIKASFGALLVSIAITIVLLFGVAILAWTRTWGTTLLWVAAGCTLIGLVAWKRDTWWLGDDDVGRRVNRGTVLLGLILLILPTGFSRWTWTAFGPVPEHVSGPADEIIALPPPTNTPPTPIAFPTILASATTTPVTCGSAVVAALRGLRLRERPGTSEPIIKALPHETRVELLCTTQEADGIQWAQVRVGERTGWVASVEGRARYLLQGGNQ